MNNPAPFTALSCVSLERMHVLAAALARQLRPGDVVTLRGEVGAGKTTFARALIQALAPDATEVTSPTFTLMQSYDVILPGGVAEIVWHLDMYRLKKAAEAHELGLQELWPHMVIIEWPQIIDAMLPQGRLDIVFDFTPSQQMRSLAFHGNDAWRSRLAEVV